MATCAANHNIEITFLEYDVCSEIDPNAMTIEFKKPWAAQPTRLKKIDN